ncbi:MAG: hypothetical protein R2822_30390 [Spirosomataceae bacterium]
MSTLPFCRAIQFIGKSQIEKRLGRLESDLLIYNKDVVQAKQRLEGKEQQA